MRPNGQLPACEWDFGDVNPPVAAWAATAVPRTDNQRRAAQDLAPDNAFLERMSLPWSGCRFPGADVASLERMSLPWSGCRFPGADVASLERMFHNMLVNLTWLVNRKDEEANNVFEGGPLGLGNIGLFDCSRPLPVPVKVRSMVGLVPMPAADRDQLLDN